MSFITYQNGNASIELHEDGTRIIQFEELLQLDYPLNIDIRVQTKCPFGRNPKTGKSICEFCHEAATTDGKECDYEKLKQILDGLPPGIEIAIGGNVLTENLGNFLAWAMVNGYVCNLTVNQLTIKGYDSIILQTWMRLGWIKGLGISYRKEFPLDIDDFFINHPNVVFHVIAGIDSVDDVLKLKDIGVKKVLVLGEKDFGFNTGKVDLSSQLHREWYWWVRKLFDVFDVVSFDNLALQQLNIRRFLSNEMWDEFNQGEHSFYINSVEGYFAPSSRSADKTDWDVFTIPEYFQLNEMQQEENR